MANNNEDFSVYQHKGSRINLVDPNLFDNQSTSHTDSKLYNMSVPLEDLCIVVELKTTTKTRTILSTSNSNSLVKIMNVNPNGDGNDVISIVNFIGGKNDSTTGGNQVLTTSYTDVSDIRSTTDGIEEALGITSIDIEFNSSYAPMVNINFIDVRGAAIFQNGANSKYGVLFKLPYPIFQLKIKGYYGKPVIYCLHLTKCSSKFNSQTGNFEIAAQFVGYTYAMLSDMLLGYIRGAQETPAGKKIMSDKFPTVLSINDFMINVSNIDINSSNGGIKDIDNQQLNNINNLKNSVENINSIIKTCISSLNNSTQIYALNSNDDKIVILPSLNTTGYFDTTIISQPDTVISNFSTQINAGQVAFNNLAASINNSNLYYNTNLTIVPSKLTISLNNLNNGNSTLLNPLIMSAYPTEVNSNDTYSLDIIINRLRKAANGINFIGNLTFYDFTNIVDTTVNKKNDAIDTINYNLNQNIINKLNATIQNKFNIDTSVRGIINVFTTAVEVFLEQLVTVSNKYLDVTRQSELLTLSKSGKLDSPDPKTTIFPWPEFSVDGVETYIGDPVNGVTNQNNVPELQFVNELYDGFQKNIQVNNDISSLNNQGLSSFYATNPIDSSITGDLFNLKGIEKNPYDRLPNNATHDDIALFIVLRAVSFLGFSNTLLTQTEIQNFVKNDISNLYTKFGTSNELSALRYNYLTVDDFGNVNGLTSTGKTAVLTVDSNNSGYTYTYLNNGNETIIPIKLVNSTTQSTTNQQSTPTLVDNFFSNKDYNFNNAETQNYLLTNKIYGDTNTNERYLEFIDKEVYENNKLTPSGINTTPFNYKALQKSSFLTSNDLVSAGFLANGGRYGVQEFTTINYDGINGVNGNTSFYTLFYNDFKSNSILRGHRGYKTIFDIPNSSDNFATFTINNKKSGADYIDYSNNSINSIFTNNNDTLVKDTIFGKTRQLLSKFESSKSTSEVTGAYLSFGVQSRNKNNQVGDAIPISLFGSQFYNEQDKNGKAFLFLHSLPWNGLTGNDSTDKSITPFNLPEILNIFKYRTGFVQVPKLFAAFVGGLLYRYSQEIIKWVDKSGNNLLPFSPNKPMLNEYLKTYGVSGFYSDLPMGFGTDGYFKINDNTSVLCDILKLPKSVINGFISQFTTFVNDFDIKHRVIFEITPLNNDWVSTYMSIYNESLQNGNQLNRDILLKYLNFGKDNNLSENYTVVNIGGTKDTYWNNNYFNHSYFLEYKDNSIISTYLISLIVDVTYIANNSYLIWYNNTPIIISNGSSFNAFSSASINGYGGGGGSSSNGNIVTGIAKNKQINISKDDFNSYMSVVLSAMTKTDTQKQSATISKSQELILKFETYRKLKKMYDKWVNVLGSPSNQASSSVLYQCCTNVSGKADRLSKDDDIAKQYGNINSTLINSFRFIDRAYSDIGADFNINPFAVNKILLSSIDNSFYDMVGRILTDNHFDFIALPSFVDYNDPDEIKNMFTPYPYYQATTQATVGPSFVCVYVGQTSTKLDFSNDSSYTYLNDGFDFTNESTLPPDFSVSAKTWEDKGAAFIVRYGQQNQNFFKDIKLDQAEFNETGESLLITDNISNKLGNTNLSYVGQNLYNVYSVRSYKAEVEMLGNAMIQPMMYFQLENIPMFHGAYLITKVKHNIIPNHMSTVFTGTRINRIKTPLISKSVMLTDLLSSYGITLNSNKVDLTSNYVIKYHQILSANLPNSIISGNKLIPSSITNTASNEYGIFGNGTKDQKEMVSTIQNYFKNNKYSIGNYDAVKKEAWSAAFISYVITASDTTFPVNASHYGYLTVIMKGNTDYEIFPLNCGLKIKPEIGDILTFAGKDGYDSSHSDIIFKIDNNTVYLMGGNKSGHVNGVEIRTVNQRTFTIENGYITDNTIFPNGNNYKLITKKTGKTYYKGKNLADYPIDSTITSKGSYGGKKQLLSSKFTPNTNLTKIYREAIGRVSAKLNISKGIQQLMEASAYAEGYNVDDTVPFYCNNPGNLNRSHQLNDVPCDHSKDSIRYAKFNSPDEGIAAQFNRTYGLILVSKRNDLYPNGPNTTLFDFWSVYAPASDGNDDTWYTNIVIDYLNIVFNFSTINGNPITNLTTLGEFNSVK